MLENQQAKFKNLRSRAAIGKRIVAGVVFLIVSGAFTMLFAAARGVINLTMIFGVCGFKQNYALPCPGCGVTTSALAFVSGDILQSFYIQPAGAILCCVLVVIAFLALLVAVFGVNFRFLDCPINIRAVKYGIVVTLIVFGVSWAVLIVRELVENSQT